MQQDWRDLSYLLHGNARQRQAHRALHDLGIFTTLREFDPVLVSTICLGIDVPDSDLDVVCEIDDPQRFAAVVESAFSHHEAFELCHRTDRTLPAVVAQFRYAGFTIEIFGEPQPVERQNAYRHHVVHARLLAIGGEAMRRAIQRLKASGLKTEAAFATHLGLGGDPYETMLALSDLSDDALREMMRRRIAEPGS